MLTNRVTQLLGVEIPIVQAPMGWIARSALASAVSNAGAMGIIETSSGELDIIREEIAKMKDLTPREIAYFAPLLAAAFWIGLYPKPVMDVLARPVEKLVRQVDPAFYQAASVAPAIDQAAKTGMAAMQPTPEAKP